MPNREQRRRDEKERRLNQKRRSSYKKKHYKRRGRRNITLASKILETGAIVLLTVIVIGYLFILCSVFFYSDTFTNNQKENVEEEFVPTPLKIDIPKEEKDTTLDNNEATMGEETNVSSPNSIALPYYSSLEGSYEDNLYWLSKIVYAESGSSYCSDELQQMVASVILNRVKCEQFPNSIMEVIFQEGQYSPVITGLIYSLEPDERTINNVKSVLETGPINDIILYQSNFPQGEIVDLIVPININDIHITNMYFCH